MNRQDEMCCVVRPYTYITASPLHDLCCCWYAVSPSIPFGYARTQMLHVQETQKQILEYAHDACHVFPGFEDQCEMYVNMYGPLVMGIIQQYLQPDAMCGRLGFCPLPPALH